MMGYRAEYAILVKSIVGLDSSITSEEILQYMFDSSDFLISHVSCMPELIFRFSKQILSCRYISPERNHFGTFLPFCLRVMAEVNARENVQTSRQIPLESS